jgi:NAD-dependent dihydropyrimidine dehydrogenase PreA subunit
MTVVEHEKKVKRKIIKIDEELCTGCGKCAIACAESALAIIDGKAKVISEIFCDGLGACIGECPEGALTIEEREAPEFSEKAVEMHLESQKVHEESIHNETHAHQCSCPSSKTIVYNEDWIDMGITEEIPSALRQWPTKLTLISPNAPYFNNHELIIVSDCSPLAYADFHRKILRGKPIVTVCPMLGLGENELQKLEDILMANPIEELNLILMEVPCCQNLKIFLEPMLAKINRKINVKETIVGRDGSILRQEMLSF